VRTIVALLLLLAVPALPALAKDKGNSGKGKGKGPPAERGGGGGGADHDEWRDDRDHHEPDGRDRYESDRDEWEHHRDRDDWRRFSDSDRRWWHDYWRDEYGRGHCPPGLAKKHNGCLPPGQAKKRYAIGRPLPADVVVIAVPSHLLGHLPPLERGYRYGMVDGDLVKLTVGTMLVVDAIDGMLR
jgi:hypothetical protein